MADANKAVPSLEEMQRRKAEMGRLQREYEKKQDREAVEQWHAWEEAHPEEAADEEATVQNILPQDFQEDASTEDNSAEDEIEDEDWEEYDGDPRADPEVAAMQMPGGEEASCEPPPYPRYRDENDRRTDPRWKWLTSQDLASTQTGNDAVASDEK